MKRELIFEAGHQQLLYFPQAFTATTIAALIASISWQQNSIRLFGKNHLEPRLTQWFGPPYSYSSVNWPSNSFPELVSNMQSELNLITNWTFNACLANYYRNGEDSMGWHRDNEPEMDTRLIASVSFGATRDFKIRHRHSKKTYTLPLENGSLLLMRYLQEDYEHCLPKRKRVLEPRVNLTFRSIK